MEEGAEVRDKALKGKSEGERERKGPRERSASEGKRQGKGGEAKAREGRGKEGKPRRERGEGRWGSQGERGAREAVLAVS